MTEFPVRMSFGDPDGQVFFWGGRYFRRVNAQVGDRIEGFLSSQVGRSLVADGNFPGTWPAASHDAEAIEAELKHSESNSGDYFWYEHQVIRFNSHPTEWIAEQLVMAGEFTLTLTEKLNRHGWDLKDASAQNVGFTFGRPIFLDLCSIVPIKRSSFWRPAGQYERNFIFPLLLFIIRGLPVHQYFKASSDGFSTGDVGQILGSRRWLSREGLRHCVLPELIQRYMGTNQDWLGRAKALDVGDYPKERQLRALKLSTARLSEKLPRPVSPWATYSAEREHYGLSGADEKMKLVSKWLRAIGGGTLLDIGANSGEYVLAASRIGYDVVAFDRDSSALRLAHELSAESNGRVQLLVKEFTSIAQAQRNSGSKNGLDERFASKFDCVLALAVIHHIVLGTSHTYFDVFSVLSKLSSRAVIVEYVPTDDPKFKDLAMLRDREISQFSMDAFEQAASGFFRLQARELIQGTGRVLFYLSK